MKIKEIINGLKAFYCSMNLIYGIFVLGAFFRWRQYVSNRSLWIDEAALAVSFVSRSFSELVLPLKYDQMAPLGFVMAERLAVVLLGPSELALRFFPLLASLLAMVMFYRIAIQLLNRSAVPLAVGLFAFHQPLIYFASEAKQYSFDVLTALVIVWIGLCILKNSLRSIQSIMLYGLIGAIAVWFSFPSIFVLVAVAFVIGVEVVCQKKKISLGLVAVLGMWFGSFLLSYVFTKSHMSSSLDTHLQNYWKDAFMPVAPSLQSVKWCARTFLNTFKYPGGFVLYPLAGILCVFGMMSFIFKKKFIELGILTAPIGLTLLASALRAYPFSDRLVLFLVPFLIMLIVQGTITMKEYFDRYSKGLGVGLMGVILLFPAAVSIKRVIQPIQREEIRPALEYLRTQAQSTDAIYVYNGAIKAFDYYSLVKPFTQKTVIGIKSREDWSEYIQDLKQLEGHSRVWFIFSHDWNAHQSSEKAFILEHLDQIGRPIDKFIVPARGATGLSAQESSVYLYDLRQP